MSDRPQKFIDVWNSTLIRKWVIDQVWGLDGWILGKFLFLCVYWPRRSQGSKRERGQYQVILAEQAWSITDLLYGFCGNFSFGTGRVVPREQDSSILPVWVADNNAGFDSSCPLTNLQWATKVVETLLGNDSFRLLSTCSYLLASSVNSLIPPAPNSMVYRRCGLCSRRLGNRNINIVWGGWEGGGGKCVQNAQKSNTFVANCSHIPIIEHF